MTTADFKKESISIWKDYFRANLLMHDWAIYEIWFKS
jgi:hypothetical protein